MHLRRISRLVALATAATLLLSAVPASADSHARVRVLHASPDAPNVDVYANGDRVLSDVPFGGISDYLSVPAGDYQLQVFAAGTTEGAVIDAAVTLETGTSYTVAATNALASIEAQVLVDDAAPAAGAAKVRAVHLSADAPEVDVAPRGAAADAAVISGLAYPDAADYLALDAGSYELDVRLAGTTTVALELPALDIAAGTSYSVFVIGSAADPAVGGNGLEAVVTVDATAPTMTAPPTDAAVDGTTPATGSVVLPAVLLIAIAAAALTVGRLATRRIEVRD